MSWREDTPQAIQDDLDFSSADLEARRADRRVWPDEPMTSGHATGHVS
jgi:hypothetical protein